MRRSWGNKTFSERTISCHSEWDSSPTFSDCFWISSLLSFFFQGRKILTSSYCKFQMGHSTILHPPLSIIFQSPAVTRKASCRWCGTTHDGHKLHALGFTGRDCTGSVDLMASAWTWACTLKSFSWLQCNQLHGYVKENSQNLTREEYTRGSGS